MEENDVTMNDRKSAVCDQCGAPLHLNQKFVGEDGFSYIKCKYCKHVMLCKEPSYAPEATAFFAQGKIAYDKQNFEDAIEAFNNAIKKSSNYYEAYWFRLLAENGIEYVEDIDGRLKPTCHRCNEMSILRQKDFISAVNYAPPAIAEAYRNNAAEFDAIRQRVLALSKRGESYDIFISFKKTAIDKNGEESSTGAVSEDSTTASAVYWTLSNKGYKVFYSEESLKGVAGADFEATIFRALDTAKVFILIGSKGEYVSATWVKNEWKRYMRMMAAGKKSPSSFVYIFNNEIPQNIDPLVIKNRQGIKFNDKDFKENLFSAVNRELNKNIERIVQQPIASEVANAQRYITNVAPSETSKNAIRATNSLSEHLSSTKSGGRHKRKGGRKLVASLLTIILLIGAGIGIYFAVDAVPDRGDSGQTLPPGDDGKYHISSADDLALLTEYSDASFVLDADIDMDGATISGYGAFSGSFDGGKHTISNFNLVSVGQKVGFFSSASDVKNLILKDFTYDMQTTDYDGDCGVLAGRNYGTIKNCAVINGKVTCNASVGGLVGYNSGSIDGCFVENVAIEGLSSQVSPRYGGLVAENDQSIQNSFAKDVSISAGHYAAGTIRMGGLVGYNHGSVNSSYVIVGELKTNNSLGKNYVGSVCGTNNKSTGSITNCWYSCEQDLQIGYNEGGSFTPMSIQGCYSLQELSNDYSSLEETYLNTVYSSEWTYSVLAWDIGKWYFSGYDLPIPAWSVGILKTEEAAG